MDDQLTSILWLAYDIFKSAAFFTFVYGSKAITWSSDIINSTINDDGWLTKLALVCLILLASLQALKMVLRGLMFWVRFALNLLLVFGSIALMAWLWSRGLDGAGEDIGIIAQFWTKQYRQYESQAKDGKAMYDALQGARDAIVNERQRAERLHGGTRFW